MLVYEGAISNTVMDISYDSAKLHIAREAERRAKEKEMRQRSAEHAEAVRRMQETVQASAFIRSTSAFSSSVQAEAVGYKTE